MPTIPQVYNQPQPAPMQVSKEAKPMDDAERIRQRLAIKQAAFASLGLDYEPNDEDVEREKQFLPADGGIVKLPDMVVEPREYREAPPPMTRSQQLANSFEDFAPEDEVDDPLDDEERALIADFRAKKKAPQGPVLQPQDVTGAP
jgi:hypothetical protein